jgi:hypothetical protein
MLAKKFTLKKNLEIFLDIENTKNKMLEDGPNLQTYKGI